MAATATKTKPITESREIKDARKAVDRLQRELNAKMGKTAEAHAEWERAFKALAKLLEAAPKAKENGEEAE